MKNSAFKLVVVALVLLCASVQADIFYVGKSGSDKNSGNAKAEAFLTIQKGLDSLKDGDTLIILSGEYHESVRRENFGSMEKDTIIKAEIPGTVVLRGDIPLGKFEPVEGKELIYVTDFEDEREIQTVNEADTYKKIYKSPTLRELDFEPQRFYQDKENKKLYIVTSDFKPASQHKYTVSVIPTHGMFFKKVNRLIIDGITVRGFYSNEKADRFDYSQRTHWGIHLTFGNNCVIRNCNTFLNSFGIGMVSNAESGNNVIENCTSWANGSSIGSEGDTGGITIQNPNRDIIKGCVAFLNGGYGTNIRGGWLDAHNIKYQSFMQDIIAWGNSGADVKIKVGHYDNVHKTIRTVAIKPTNAYHPESCLLWEKNFMREAIESKDYVGKNNIFLEDEKDIDMFKEFADHINHDYRLQETSRFRKSGPDGKDRGPYQYQPNIYYLSPIGDDKNNGLSVEKSFQTLSHALSKLKAGDTLYLMRGVYEMPANITLSAAAEKPISFRARGIETVILRENSNILNSANIDFKRIYFLNKINITGSKNITLKNCRFSDLQGAVSAQGSNEIKFLNNNFVAFKSPALDFSGCNNIDLRGNLFDNKEAAAIKTDNINSVKYSGYNSYSKNENTWQVNSKVLDLAALQQYCDKYSRIIAADVKAIDAISLFENPFSIDPRIVEKFKTLEGLYKLENPEDFLAHGYLMRPFGNYRYEKPKNTARIVKKPEVFSVSATSANIEWMTSFPLVCTVAWGRTQECKDGAERVWINNYTNYTLKDLEPNTKYFFKINDVFIIYMISRRGMTADILDKKTEPISFTTLDKDPEPVNYYVAKDGSDKNDGLSREKAFKTIQKAADTVRPGDTVNIGEGKYTEDIRVRSSGLAGKPITFKSLPFEKVIIDGAERKLKRGFECFNKHFINFDGMYFELQKYFNRRYWQLDQTGGIFLYKSQNINVSRCFSDGRVGYTPGLVTGNRSYEIAIRNCVMIKKMSMLSISDSNGILIENNVFAMPSIQATTIHFRDYRLRDANKAKYDFTYRNNIFTDNLHKKGALNIGVFYGTTGRENLQNNCFFLRFPVETRKLFNRKFTIPEFDKEYGGSNSIVEDPKFKVLVDMDEKQRKSWSINLKEKPFYMDSLMLWNLPLDFDSFFATNPKLIERNIGLERKAFKDFHFNKKINQEEDKVKN